MRYIVGQKYNDKWGEVFNQGRDYVASSKDGGVRDSWIQSFPLSQFKGLFIKHTGDNVIMDSANGGDITFTILPSILDSFEPERNI